MASAREKRVTVRAFRLTTLTPVHVGSGEQLERDIDFFASNGRTFVVDPERLIEIGFGPGGLAENASPRDAIGRLVKTIAPQQIARASFSGEVAASFIRAAQRSADGRVMLPGSSLKGALRTLLLAAWAGNNEPHGGVRPSLVDGALRESLQCGGKYRARVLEEQIFRARRPGGPHGDVLRALSASDAFFRPDCIDVRSTRAVGTRRETLTAVEAIPAGSEAVVTVMLDPKRVDKLETPFPLPTYDQLATWSQRHARHLLEKDIPYFRKSGESAVADACERLLDLVAKLAASAPKSIVLRLGWGTGWRTMTGDILSDAERDQLRMRLLKTRKVLLDGHGKGARPNDVLGWVRLDPIEGGEAGRLFVAPIAAARPTTPSTTRAGNGRDERRASAGPATNPFDESVAALRPNEVGRIGGIVSQIVRQAESGAIDAAERDRRFRLLAARVSALWGTDRSLMKRMRAIAALAPYLQDNPRPTGT